MLKNGVSTQGICPSSRWGRSAVSSRALPLPQVSTSPATTPTGSHGSGKTKSPGKVLPEPKTPLSFSQLCLGLPSGSCGGWPVFRCPSLAKRTRSLFPQEKVGRCGPQNFHLECCNSLHSISHSCLYKRTHNTLLSLNVSQGFTPKRGSAFLLRLFLRRIWLLL